MFDWIYNFVYIPNISLNMKTYPHIVAVQNPGPLN